MKLNLYRRHRPECESGRPEDSRSIESEERRKGWGRKCLCPIQLSGTLGSQFSRKSTGTSEWSEAQRIADAYELQQRSSAYLQLRRPESWATAAAPAF